MPTRWVDTKLGEQVSATDNQNFSVAEPRIWNSQQPDDVIELTITWCSKRRICACLSHVTKDMSVLGGQQALVTLLPHCDVITHNTERYQCGLLTYYRFDHIGDWQYQFLMLSFIDIIVCTDSLSDVMAAVLIATDRPSQLEDRPSQLEHRPRQPEDRPRQLDDRTNQLEDRPKQLDDMPSQLEDRPSQIEDRTRQLDDRPRQ